MSSSGANTKNAGGGWEGNTTNNPPPDVPAEGSSEGLAMSLTSDEVNYLVFRYLQESGFVHSAFTFVYESMLGKTSIRNGDRTIPPGALISFLQKGLQYVGIEESLHRERKKGQKGGVKNEPTATDEVDFSLLSQPVIAALTRTDPPIQLNLPPAAAAAAVKARLETEAKLQTAREEREHLAALSDQRTSNPSSIGGLVSLPHQQQVLEQNAMVGSLNARDALVAQAAVAQAAAASPFGAAQHAGINAMQLALQQQQQQLQLQEQVNNVQAQQCRADAEAQGLLALSSAPLASNKPSKSGKADKRSLKKNKANKKSQQQQQSDGTAAASNPLHLISQAPASATPGFSSLEEAVARLEASQNSLPDNADMTAAQPMDVEGANDQVDPTKAAPQQERSNGQHGFQPNGSIPPNGTSTDALTQSQASDAAVASNQTETSAADKEIDREDTITNASQSEILELRMHSSEVFMCAWNPVFTSFIATGSGDASARIWQMGGTEASSGLGPVRLLPHGEDPRDKKNKDVTTLEWSSDGTLLATGSYDGVARVWSRGGTLLHTLRGHKGPIFSLKWNKRGNYLLSGSYDKTTIVWDVSGSSGFVEQQFNDHQAPALDVDWKDDTTFASCSTDKTVNICKVGVSRPLKTFSGHTDEVNAVKWDPSGTLLASCSDDCTAKVWDVTSDSTGPLQDFKSHRQEIYTVKWSPTGPGSQNPHKQRILATASFDGSVRLWNVEDGSCIRVFSRHRDSVYSVAFSPSGSFLASGSLAGQLYIWNVQEGVPVKSYKGKGDIFEVAWNKEETRVAACFSSNTVAILDFKIKP